MTDKKPYELIIFHFGPGVLVCTTRGGGRSEAGHCFHLLFLSFFFFFFFLFLWARVWTSCSSLVGKLNFIWQLQSQLNLVAHITCLDQNQECQFKIWLFSVCVFSSWFLNCSETSVKYCSIYLCIYKSNLLTVKLNT